MEMDFKNMDAQAYLKTIQSGTIDLILTDPPYIISRDSGMNSHYNKVKENENKKRNTMLVKKRNNMCLSLPPPHVASTSGVLLL